MICSIAYIRAHSYKYDFMKRIYHVAHSVLQKSSNPIQGGWYSLRPSSLLTIINIHLRQKGKNSRDEERIASKKYIRVVVSSAHGRIREGRKMEPHHIQLKQREWLYFFSFISPPHICSVFHSESFLFHARMPSTDIIQFFFLAVFPLKITRRKRIHWSHERRASKERENEKKSI